MVWRLIPCRLLNLLIFFSILWVVFVLFMVSFTMQKLLTLTRSHLSIFVFIFITPADESKKILLMFSSKSFLVSGLTYRSLTHLELIFVYGVRECYTFFFLHEVAQFSQHHLLKSLTFLHYIVFPPSP